MKRFLVTEDEKKQIMDLYKQVITEESEVVNPVRVAMDAKKEMETTGINYNVVKLDDVVDSNEPTCIPQTDDETNNGIIARVWDWANNPENRGNLKQTLFSLKNAIFKAKDQVKGDTSTTQTTTVQVKDETQPMNEQVETALITIAGVSLGPSVLIAIGAILLIIIIVAIVSKSGGKRRSSCKRRSKLFKRHGIDGMFM